jgi:hypothetical protein
MFTDSMVKKCITMFEKQLIVEEKEKIKREFDFSEEQIKYINKLNEKEIDNLKQIITINKNKKYYPEKYSEKEIIEFEKNNNMILSLDLKIYFLCISKYFFVQKNNQIYIDKIDGLQKTNILTFLNFCDNIYTNMDNNLSLFDKLLYMLQNIKIN